MSYTVLTSCSDFIGQMLFRESFFQWKGSKVRDLVDCLFVWSSVDSLSDAMGKKIFQELYPLAASL